MTDEPAREADASTRARVALVRDGMAMGYENGIEAAARMARDMSDKMLEGKLPHVGGSSALQLFAVMLDRIIEKDVA